MINVYAYRLVRSAFLRNVNAFAYKREAVERMVQARKELVPELVAA